MMSYRIIYIESNKYLRLYLDNLQVELNGDEINIPVADIQILVIDNYRATITVPLLVKLADANVTTIICGPDHLPSASIYPNNGYFATSGNLQKQLEWRNKDLVHGMIVQSKIRNQREVLLTNNKSQDVVVRLMQYEAEVLEGDKTNREGLAAKVYFRELYGKDFIRFDETVINAGLNYGYAIFRSLISSIICAKGYSPNFGIFHKGKTNGFNFSDDIIEVFRPIVDDFVYCNMMNDSILHQDRKEQLIKLTNKKIEYDHKIQTIPNVIGQYIDTITAILEGDNVNYQSPYPKIYDI